MKYYLQNIKCYTFLQIIKYYFQDIKYYYWIESTLTEYKILLTEYEKNTYKIQNTQNIKFYLKKTNYVLLTEYKILLAEY